MRKILRGSDRLVTARLAQRLYDDGEHTVSEIAEMLDVTRTTLYGHPAKSEHAQPVAG